MSWLTDLINQGSQDFRDYANIEVDRRNRDHAERRADRLRRQDRALFLRDRDYDEDWLLRLRTGAEEAGLHPLAVLGAQAAGPATAFQSQSYEGGGGPPANFRNTTSSYDEVNSAHARLLNKQADLVEMQIEDSKDARIRNAVSPEDIVLDLGKPVESTPQTHTPVLERMKTDPSVADAQAKTTRYGESELYETLLWLRTKLADYMYQWTGMSEAERDRRYRERYRKILGD